MINRSEMNNPMPINIVGSSTFGRYPKISTEKTYNMFMSDNFMVPYSGYKSIKDANGSPVSLGNHGRAIFYSNINQVFVGVFDLSVYTFYLNYNAVTQTYSISGLFEIGVITNPNDNVYISENNAGQVAIVDGSLIYIWDKTQSNPFQTPVLDFTPNYITFHDSRFICSVQGSYTWRISASENGLSWSNSADAASVGYLQTKPDFTKAVLRFPSRGNMIFVFGSNVTEAWFDVGYQLFPYQRTQSFNIDYGCLSAPSIAYVDELVVWLGKNETSGPIILASTGGMPEKITTDGIDYLLSQLIDPSDSEAFMYRQDGHLFYHINFYTDNLSLFYDFNTNKFYHASDENLDCFIAKDLVFSNNQYFFISKNNGYIYAFDTIYTTYDGAIIPRIRTCKNVRLPTQENFIVNDLGFTIETGVTEYEYINSIVSGVTTPIPVTPRVDFSFSIDGGNTFGNDLSYDLNPIGRAINMLRWWNLGMANDFVPQFKFLGIGRFVVTDGLINIRQ